MSKKKKKQLIILIGSFSLFSLLLIGLFIVINRSVQIATEDSSAAIEIKAFPTAVGQGQQSMGGRGGSVIKVTNLFNDGPSFL